MQPEANPKPALREQDPKARRIYPLTRLNVEYVDGAKETVLPTPEQVAVAIAKCSRSDAPFDQNVMEVSLEKAAAFHEKWVVGYGHGSVAEHAVASVAIENVSQIVIKILEDSRLASFTEKSSRYVVFSRDRVHVPTVLREGVLGQAVADYFKRLYDLYDRILDAVKPLMLERFPQPKEMHPKAYAAVTKARICDVARSCLPAAATGKLGMTANARVWANTITKLASSEHEEARAVAEELIRHLRAADGESPDDALQNRLFPTLLKYASYNEYLASLPETLKQLEQELIQPTTDKTISPTATLQHPVVLLRDDAHAELRIATALLGRVSRLPLAVIQTQLGNEPKMVDRIIREAVRQRGEHDQLPRAFEHAVFQHEIVMDYGAWRDVQRHRMCTQINQSLGVDLGYIRPEEIDDVGLAKTYEGMMEEAATLHQQIRKAGYEHEAEYIVPMAYRRRCVMTWNARELDHFISLRSGKKGHPSYRKIAQEVWGTMEQTHPLLAELIKVDLSGSEEGLSTLGAKPKGF
ncbi:hypothetical protein GF380_03465 [Candidatus Uhrbacteria bacterium]|nr:hypothetical protein [Candidatus Uhrbacteria bacterium]MBD3284190.1 hypothetical protein [Candidatus Uhrbacteria bacterium]